MVKRRRGERQVAVQKEEMPQSWRCLLSLYLGRDRLRIADVERETGIHRNTLYRYYHDRMRVIDLEEVAVLLRLFKLSSIGDFFQLIDAASESTSAADQPKLKTHAGVLPKIPEIVTKKKPVKRAAKKAKRS